jgi:cytochrome c oxidase assembly protein subunit 15
MFLSVVTVIVQIALGILTLWYAVPVVLGVAHQAVAFLLFSLLVVALYQARHAREVA